MDCWHSAEVRHFSRIRFYFRGIPRNFMCKILQNTVEFRGKHYTEFRKNWRHGNMETWKLGDMETRRNEAMETWRHGEIETWRHGDIETWRHGDMDIETWRHGIMQTWMETWTWRHGHGDMDMETWTWRYGIKISENSEVLRKKLKGKWKSEAQAIFLNTLTAHRANGSLPFVRLLRKKQTDAICLQTD